MTKPGTLVVTHFNPAQQLRRRLIIGGLWLLSLIAVYVYCKQTMTPNFARTQTQLTQTQRELIQQQSDMEALKQEVAKYQRGEQVAKESNSALQSSLNDKLQEIQTLRADLSFFHRFASGGNGEAFGIQDITLQATDNPRAFKFAIAVAQNLNRGKVAQGKLRFSVSGLQAGKAKRLEMSTLLGEGGSSELNYEFKYFQLLSGTLYLPENFTPGAIAANMKNTDGEAAKKEVSWEAAIKLGQG